MNIGGEFTQVGSTPANRLARENWGGTTTAPTLTYDAAFTPAVSCVTTCVTPTVKALASPSATLLLVGGLFEGVSVNGGAVTARNNAAGFGTAGSGTILGWSPNTNGVVNAIGLGAAPTTAVPGPVYLGGQFTHAGPVPGGVDVTNVVAFGITSTGANSAAPTLQMNAAPSTGWVPTGIDGVVNAISAGSTTSTSYIAIGGDFKKAQGSVRHRIALYVNQTPASTGAATLQPLTAHAGNTVFALGRDSATRLIAGGAFKVLGGVVRNNVAEIGGGAVTPFVADTDQPVTTVAANAANVYLAGSFTQVNGTPRAGLAGVKASDNSVTTFATSVTGGVVKALAATTDAVYAGGSFTGIGRGSFGSRCS